MNHSTLEKIASELRSALVGRRFGKIFTLSRLQTAFDFRLPESVWLFVSVEPNAPRIYLIRRRSKDLDKISGTPLSFTLFLRKRLGSAVLEKIEKIENERVLRFEFAAESEIGNLEKYTLVVQLTGRSANLFLLDERDFILDSLRENVGAGQENADRYAAPQRDSAKTERRDEQIFPQGDFETLSEALDVHHLEKEAERSFQARAKAAETVVSKEITKLTKLNAKLEQDLKNHGNAEHWKRSGDLILANLADAVREDGKILVVDYYDENAPVIEIEADPRDSLTEAAEKFFRRYTKARNAKTEIAKRLAANRNELEILNERKTHLLEAIAERDESIIEEFTGKNIAKTPVKSREKQTEGFKGARSFTSAEGYEILVGKASKDNDFLTFRVAKSLDLWLHAADYPGSHVVVRNPNRNEIPPNTLLEAAQIAAFYSQARTQPKVAVHYTQKKFVGKPKGAAAGLVSLSSFKTILVEPKIEAEKTV